MLTDLRYALRQLWKEPRFTFVAVLALALGIGANTAIFSVVNAVLLKPLPFPAPEELIAWGSIDRDSVREDGFNSVSYPDFFDFRTGNESFAQLATFRRGSLALTGNGPAQSLGNLTVSGNFFDALGVRPQLGRTFRLNEEKTGGGPDGLTAVLSHELWVRQFRSDRAIIGKSITLSGLALHRSWGDAARFSIPARRGPDRDLRHLRARGADERRHQTGHGTARQSQHPRDRPSQARR